jgi:hypothetical protein
MRIVSVVACVAFFAGAGFAGTGSALAADCNKGMLWPFVRTTGDCLTDVEIASGKSGVYTGPVNTNVDVSAIKPAETPAQSDGVSSSGSSGGGLFGSSIFSGSLFGSSNSSTPGNVATTTTAPSASPSPNSVTTGNASRGDGALISSSSIFGGGAPDRPGTAVNCTKGAFWPFQREPGDCLTETEKKAGKTGVYGGGPGLTQASLPATNAPADAATGQAAPTAPASAPAQATCQKGWFWPFVKESNNCPTDVEKKEGKGASIPAATQVSAMNSPPPAGSVAPSAAPAPAPSAATPACHKGLLWPFVRDAGDCQTEQEKKNAGEK